MIKRKEKIQTVLPDPIGVIGTDGIFNSDNENQKRLGFNRNRVMPQTDIEYERDKLSNDPQYKVFSDGENSHD